MHRILTLLACTMLWTQFGSIDNCFAQSRSISPQEYVASASSSLVNNNQNFNASSNRGGVQNLIEIASLPSTDGNSAGTGTGFSPRVAGDRFNGSVVSNQVTNQSSFFGNGPSSTVYRPQGLGQSASSDVPAPRQSYSYPAQSTPRTAGLSGPLFPRVNSFLTGSSRTIGSGLRATANPASYPSYSVTTPNQTLTTSPNMNSVTNSTLGSSSTATSFSNSSSTASGYNALPASTAGNWTAFRQTTFQSPTLGLGPVGSTRPVAYRVAQNCYCAPAGTSGAANTAPSLNANAGQSPNLVAPQPLPYQLPANTGFPQFGGTNSSALVVRQNYPPGTYLGQGIIGQPTAYVDGQPVRNLMRYIFP